MDASTPRQLRRTHFVHALLAGLLVVMVHLSGLTLGLDKRTYDLWFQLSPTSDRPAEHVVVVALDAASLREEQFGPWPWPSRRLAELLRTVQRARPAAVGLDVLLDRRRDSSDGELVQALSEMQNVVVATSLREAAGGRALRIEPPRPEFLAVTQAGFTNAAEDHADGSVRSWWLAVRDGDATACSFPVLLALNAAGRRAADVRVDGDWVWLPQGTSPRSRWPLLTPIDFRRPGRLPVLSSADVLRGRVRSGALAGKVVLIGGTAAGEFPDVFLTPFSDDLTTGRSASTHGVEILANAVETLLGGTRVGEAPPLAVAALALVFVLGLAAALRWTSPAVGAGAVLALVAGSAAACLLLFTSSHLQVPVTPFALGGIAAYVVVALEKHSEAEARQRLAEQRNALLRDLSAMVTHDLQGPLTGVTGFLDLLSREPLTERQQEIVSFATGGSQWLSILVGGILDVAKMEAGQVVIQRQLVDVGAEFRQALTAVSYHLQTKRLHVDVAVAPELPPLPADPELFRRIVVNLVGNAAKFAPDGSTIRLEAHREAERDAVAVSVADEGPGVPREYQDRIFDKFVQVGQDRSAEKISVGLGLAFCRLAVEAHGGHIWVESEPRRGARFSFALPLTICDARPGQRPRRSGVGTDQRP